VLLVSFLPMLCIAFAYDRMNRADPDAGTSFAWVTRAMGPQLGRLSGWAVTLVGCAWIVVMTRICLIGIELNALTQKVLLGAELAILALFAVVALAKGGAASPSREWLNPSQVPSWSASAGCC
jgi:amino acid transporter